MNTTAQDLTGVGYWDEVWSAPPKPAFDPKARCNKTLVRLLDRFLSHVPPGGTVLEAGCGDSVVAAYIHGLGFRTTGIDYSEIGYERFRRSSPMSTAILGDIFNPPSCFANGFDAVFSLGLVEHFADTARPVRAISQMVRPGGVLLTVVPNLRGSLGFLQSLINREALDLHLMLTPAQLAEAHADEVLSCGYLGGMGYGALNPGRRFLPRAIVGLLARASLIAQDAPVSRTFSPHLYCLARRHANA